MEVRRRHPIAVALYKLPVSYRLAAFFIALLTYLAFILIALLTGLLPSLMISFLHFLQIDFSITIFIGLCFLDIFYRTYDKKLGEMRNVFVMADEEYDNYLDSIFDRMNSSTSILAGLPFVAIAMGTIYLFIMPTMPNPLFPVDAYSPIWLYFAFIEFSIIMLLLFGVGVWIGIVANSVAAKIGKNLQISLKPISPDRAGGLVSFSEAMLKGVFMYSALVALVFPLLVLITHYLQRFNPFMVYIPIVGLILALSTVVLFFLAPQYSIHKVMVDEKKRLLRQVSEEVNDIIGDIHGALDSTSDDRPDIPPQQLMLVSLQLTQLFEQIEKMRTWPSDMTIIVKAVSALVAVTITFVLNQVLLIYLEEIWAGLP